MAQGSDISIWCSRRQEEQRHLEAGFSLLEVCAAVALVGLSLAVSLLGVAPVLRAQQVTQTAQSLIWDFRETQALSQVKGPYAVLDLHKYQPQYDILVGPQVVSSKTFLDGVDYKDGYLQMGTGWVAFDSAGDAHVAGVVRLTDGVTETDVHLYTGAGWVSLGPDAASGGSS
ncbi:pilus assembly FimT family protein [Alicyclobacillus shizuokensis]|uniref:pilus assembly FimT family protein n=1 Tax=Alicyclobacillus shizuokensis TaxID=392014 RepID=UPI0008316AA4|nr:hypothetical protein [Alicyclobacillus shizuokensis]MCL6625389.1 hypothetical protein [Alicyclobacillus shizuokensis]